MKYMQEKLRDKHDDLLHLGFIFINSIFSEVYLEASQRSIMELSPQK